MTRPVDLAVIVLATAACAGAAACWLDAIAGGRARAFLERWRTAIETVARDGAVNQPRPPRGSGPAAAAVSAVAGFSLLGPAGAAIGLAAGPFVLRAVVKLRRERYAARIDSCAAEFALALASALSAGNSVRGALAAAGRSIPEPLALEVERATVDLTLGGGVEDAISGLRARTASARIESIAGAIELHRNSGGDLVQLMRELADAFRSRDVALRDANAATAQARFTAGVVAAIPLTLAAVAELARPGVVSGAFAFAPTALMLLLAGLLLATGCWLSFRLGRVG